MFGRQNQTFYLENIFTDNTEHEQLFLYKIFIFLLYHMCAAELKTAKGEQVIVSCDGTWQRRGFQSKNGVFTLLSAEKENTKVLDTVQMSSYCDSCAKYKKNFKNRQADYVQWKPKHDESGECQRNHAGTAGGMKSAGALTAFQCSVERYGLQYPGFLGDGDSKSFATVSDNNIYPGVEIEKLECCGHVQKRMR